MFDEIFYYVQRNTQEYCSCVLSVHYLLSRTQVSWGLSAPSFTICSLALPHRVWVSHGRLSGLSQAYHSAVSGHVMIAGMATRLWCLPWPWLCACTLASAALAQKPRLDDVAFGVASHSNTFCDRFEKYTSSWWRDGLNGVILVNEMTPNVEECLKEFKKTFPSLKVADAPKPPPDFVDWVGGGGERIIWSQIHILRKLFPDKR